MTQTAEAKTSLPGVAILMLAHVQAGLDRAVEALGQAAAAQSKEDAASKIQEALTRISEAKNEVRK